MSAVHDRGLRALGRVREVRERDSRVGLAQALAEQRERERTLAGLERTLREQAAFTTGDVGEFVRLRAALRALGEAVVRARDEVASAAVVTAAADAHWRLDKTRLSAVEHLLEQRAAERRAERDREAAKALDEAAGQVWLRGAARARAHEEVPA